MTPAAPAPAEDDEAEAPPPRRQLAGPAAVVAQLAGGGGIAAALLWGSGELGKLREELKASQLETKTAIERLSDKLDTRVSALEGRVSAVEKVTAVLEDRARREGPK